MTPKERAEKFNEELKPLLDKYKIGIGAVPVILSDGRLGARPEIYDAEEMSKRLKEKNV